MSESSKQDAKDAKEVSASSKNAPTLLKTMGAVLFFAASVGTMVHRMPKRKYVEAIPDRPLPAAAKPAPVAAKPVLVAAAPKPKAPVDAGKPGQGQSQVAAASPGEALLSADPVEDWRDTCSAEIGILCNNVAEGRLPRCLHQYDDALRKGCLKALLTLRGAPRPEDL